MSNKISLPLILKRKSCICCQKLCRSLFPEAHGMCSLKEIFEGAGNFFDKKVSCKSHFSIWKKLNLILFIKNLIKEFTSHPLRFAQHLLPKEKALKPFRQATLDTFPFRDGFRIGKAPMKGELSRSD